MTVLHFRFFPERTSPSLLRHAFFASWGRIPQRTQADICGNVLTVSTDTTGTGTLHVPLVHSRFGLMVQSTETLRSRAKPYLLSKELARGSLGRLTRRLAEWQLLGFQLPATLKSKITATMRQMAIMVTTDEGYHDTDKMALTILEQLDEITLELTEHYVDQSMAARKQGPTLQSLFLGMTLDEWNTPQRIPWDISKKWLKESSDVVNVVPLWREMEPVEGVFSWEPFDNILRKLETQSFKIAIGPLVRFDRDYLPQWILDILDTNGDISMRATRFARAVAEHYGNRFAMWNIAGHFAAPSLGTKPTSLWVHTTLKMAETLRKCGITTPIGVTIEQPWGDGRRHDQGATSAFLLAEPLVTCRHIDTLILNVNIGFDRYDTLPRDPLSYGSLLDQWGYQGKKLVVALSVPSHLQCEFNRAGEKNPVEWNWTEKVQQQWLHYYLLVSMAKRQVTGVLWNQWQDPLLMTTDTDTDMDTPDGYPVYSDEDTGQFYETGTKYPPEPTGHQTAANPLNPQGTSSGSSIAAVLPFSGLLTAEGGVKPALQRWIAIRQMYFHEG